MEDGHSKTVEECVGFFRVDSEKGLTPDQVKEYQKKYGPNAHISAQRREDRRDSQQESYHRNRRRGRRSGHVELVPIYVSSSSLVIAAAQVTPMASLVIVIERGVYETGRGSTREEPGLVAWSFCYRNKIKVRLF
ncbi:hypothetical protein pipiens_019012 [Culex pipiens pipiens]|uniref:Cation-transporting P-type ATPase N-terminal domain-containing protein n=1 Tax=Culex pipiens pipiens TaxID=38569 RepID=A0ABD1DXK4_CULPP